MLNILIVDTNIEFCKEIINETNKINSNFHFCAIANNIIEMQSALNNYSIDVILININILQDIVNKNILDISCYSLILLSNKNNIETLKKKLNSLAEFALKTNKVEKIIKSKIEKELKYLGYNLKYNGTKYLKEAIYILHTKENYYDDNLEKDIYPIIAKKYNKTVNNIKCNIINSTDNMFVDCKEEILMDYVGFYETYKPGPKTIILSILNNL